MNAAGVSDLIVIDSEKKTTLAARKKKKSKKKKPVRNLLLAPYEPFWPVIDSEDDCRVRELLKELLPAAKSNPVIVDGPGSSRNFRKGKKPLLNCSDIKSPERKYLRGLIFIGVNAVARAAEKRETSGVLLASDVDPLFLNQHLATLCVTHGVPVLVVPSLREVTRTYLGFSCIALGLRNQTKGNHFNQLHLMIQELTDSYELPPHLKQLRDSQEKTMKLVDKPDNSSKIASISVAISAQQVQPFRPSSDLYIYRTSPKTRVFVPHSRHEEPGDLSSSKIIPDTTPEFLALGPCCSEERKELPPVGISHVLVSKKLQTPMSYVPFRIKPVKPKSRKRQKTNK